MRLNAFIIPAMLFVSGCSVGPDYKGPPEIAGVSGAQSGFVRGPARQNASVPPGSAWWEALEDPLLNDLILRARNASPDVAVAIARIRQGRAQTRLQGANFLPDFSSNTSYARARFPSSGDDAPASNVETYFQGFDASWEIDIFGEKRRALEAAKANHQEAEAGLDDVLVTLSAEVARTYVNLRAQQQRQSLYQNSNASLERTLALMQQRFQRGTAARSDVLRLDTQLQQSRSQTEALNIDREVSMDKLAILLGIKPGDLDKELERPAPIPLPPLAPAIDDPTALLRRRPDIRQAERRLASNTAKIGQAQAARFPKVKFTGLIGTGGLKPSDLTQFDDFTAYLAPQISWDFLDFGRNAARVQTAKGARDEAMAQYRKTVFNALQETEDALSRFKNDRIRVATLARSHADAVAAVGLTRQRYQRGTATFMDLLDTERQAISSEQELSQTQAELTTDYIAIQKALGVGASNSK
ncbi:efflux transporter outer membrane subunit [Gluconobacter thailandicus]|uniref:Efflux transporter outer membrane subunit n=1 Tax=Gluconobacter thailandicus TaxID=257438 RepID=A0AAP9JIZ2_GLUTH|nr:efflux transporter outer membrane subunit [Gluconobacter thailandicus]KXV35954.1 RND transporter [Gluconobacter thailandicus]QEH96949.1 efflux transporter outer membrane subunit [Gluconobacter thailandicus]